MILDNIIYDDKVSSGQLKANNKPFYFDYKSGEYGYNTSSSRGADTFHPFNQINFTNATVYFQQTLPYTIANIPKNTIFVVNYAGTVVTSVSGGTSFYGNVYNYNGANVVTIIGYTTSTYLTVNGSGSVACRIFVANK